MHKSKIETMKANSDIMRKILIELTIDWDDYDDVCDELIVEDIFENWDGKHGVNFRIIRYGEK